MLGFEVVFVDGMVVLLMNWMLKNNVGYDLK